MIRRIAVLGAGVMGAQIAAHCVNAGFPTILFDLPAKTGPANALVQQAIQHLKKIRPSPLAAMAVADSIVAANYEQDSALLLQCDLIIEAVAETLAIKQALYAKISPFIHHQAYLVSNTSGLSIQQLAQVLPEKIRTRFCGVHFFNPPRYMKLVELIAHSKTAASMLDDLESFLTMHLGKTVVRAQDTPAFIANRVGVFSMLAMIQRAQAYQIPFEVVDALTGVAFGRAKSALFRTIDVVGIDVLAHVVGTMAAQLPNDPWHAIYQMPEFLQHLQQQGALGQKTGAGVYRKQGQDLWVFDSQLNGYRPATDKANPAVLALLAIKNPAERLAALQASLEPQAQFLWHCLSDLFHYSAYHLTEMAESARDVDVAMCCGFAWQQGVFDLWQQAGWTQIVQRIDQDIAEKKALVPVPLPEWVQCAPAYQQDLAYAPLKQAYVGRSTLAVYQRQHDANAGTTLFETEAVRLWTLDQTVAILSFKTKMNVISEAVLDGVLAAVSYVEQHCLALVIWQGFGPNFSFGANLNMVEDVFAQKGIDGIKPIVEKFQKMTMALRYCAVPTVAAVRGMVLGGACEMIMHCTKTVAAFESYIGLVEVGVGLLPAGAGLKELALRAWQQAGTADPYRDIEVIFKQVAMGIVSTSASEAKLMRYLKTDDVVLMNADEILFVALAQAKALAASAYKPPIPPKFPVIGQPGIANLQMLLTNMKAGDFISNYDYDISFLIASILCGGAIDAGCLVDEEWFLRLEREGFCRLLKHKKTQERIRHMLTQGKALRN